MQVVGVFRCSGTLCFICQLVCYSERRLWHVFDELFSSTFALHFYFVPDGTVVHMHLYPMTGVEVHNFWRFSAIFLVLLFACPPYVAP